MNDDEKLVFDLAGLAMQALLRNRDQASYTQQEADDIAENAFLIGQALFDARPGQE